MIFLFTIILVFGGWYLIATWFDSKNMNDYDASKTASGIFFLVLLGMSLVINFALWDNQISDKTRFHVIDEKIDLYQNRADEISKQLETVLIDNYGDHEKEIFSNMTGEGLQLLLIKYPELRASETFVRYGDKMQELYDEVFKSKAEKINIVRRMEYRRESIFSFGFLYPKLD